MLNDKEIKKLDNTARKIRQDILQMSYWAKSAHSGGSLSCVEILTTLYFYFMRVNPRKPYDSKRDRLIFSKGHDCKALYAVLAERGFFSKSLLKTHEENNSKLPGHPVRRSVAGVEVSTGSLGHGLPIAAGMAFSARLDSKKHRTFVIMSDGECDEGSTWEAALFAAHHNLNNLTAIIDYNKLQGFGYTKDVLNLEPFTKKWESFGWYVKEVNGHDFSEILGALNSQSTKPLVIIAHTIKGNKGPRQHINKLSSHYKPPTEKELEELTKKNRE